MVEGAVGGGGGGEGGISGHSSQEDIFRPAGMCVLTKSLNSQSFQTLFSSDCTLNNTLVSQSWCFSEYQVCSGVFRGGILGLSSSNVSMKGSLWLIVFKVGLGGIRQSLAWIRVK